MIGKFMLWVKFKTKHENNCSSLPKLIEVVMSCDTVEQCAAARNYLRIYVSKFDGTGDDPFVRIVNKVADRLNAFLTDTEHHIEHGWHKINPADQQTINKYPNMNDYLGKLIGWRFSPSWVRGKSSIILD